MQVLDRIRVAVAGPKQIDLTGFHGRMTLEFLQAWHKWAIGGGRDHDVFRRCHNLLVNLERWCDHRRIDMRVQLAMEVKLLDLWYWDGLDQNNPFCTPEQRDEEHHTQTAHQNHKRLNWVYKVLFNNNLVS